MCTMICIDDAVVIDEQHPENVVTNDGTTMRIMAQKSAQPSAWTRQKEVIVGQPATAILVENARKAKAEVAFIEAEIAEEAAEIDKQKADQKASNSEKNPKATKPQKHTGEDEKPSVEAPSDESGSTKDVAEDEEAPEENLATSDEGTAMTPQSSSDKTASGSEKLTKIHKIENSAAEDIPTSTDVAKTPRGRAASTEPVADTKATKPATEQPASEKLLGKPVHSNGDPMEMNPKAIEETIQGNAIESDKAHRGLVAANLQANSGKPPPQKKPSQRSSSSDRVRQTALPTGPPNRAAIRSALTGKRLTDAAKAAKDEAEMVRRQAEEAELLAEHRRDQKALQLQQRKDEMDRRTEDRDEQRAIRAEKRAWDAKRREDARKAIENAANLQATSLQDLEKIRAQNQFVERFSGMAEQSAKYDFDPTAPRGPSQNVTYTSRFVDRLSDVTEDMSVSASLSIKAGKVGGSGKGSFVDSDKFKESDLNFYISVKVVNQTINFKDPLVYNPLSNIDKDNFREVYGDSFISGFVEGGEFNAVVSMKILNKAKKSDIQAEAKVALTVGPVDVSGQANLGIARSNIQTNTETTIQVSWSGGGHIKPMEQQWDIHSLMSAAARFPDLVADCPQRTYAILTKYDSLRSFVARKPASYTALQYENAQLYTSTLLDSFVSYKSLYKRLGEQIYGVQTKLLEITPWTDEEQKNVEEYSTAVTRMGTKDPVSGLYPHRDVDKYFEASITGLSSARTAIRRQMARIVNEVDLMEKNPKLATDEDHVEPYQSPVAFEARLPTVDVPERLRVKGNPLSGKSLTTKTLSESEQKAQLEAEAELAKGGPLYTAGVDGNEVRSFDSLLLENPTLSAHFRASSAVGESDNAVGKLFNNLEFLKSDWVITSIRTEMANGALVFLAVHYGNGLVSQDKARVKKFGPFAPGERINSASIEHGKRKGENMPKQVLGLRLFTNRGRSLIARALHSDTTDKGLVTRDGVIYEEVKVQYMDMPFNSGTIKGFFGRSDDSGDGKIYRLGVIWCRLDDLKPEEAEADFTTAEDVVDLDDLALLQKDQTTGNKALEAIQQRLENTEQLAKTRQDIATRDSKIAELERLRKPVWEAQSGSFSAKDKGWPGGQNIGHNCAVTFSKSYPSPPKLLFGLSAIDCESGKPRCLSLAGPEVTASGFSVHAAAWNNTYGYRIDCNWMTLPDDLHLETGMLYTGNGNRGAWEEDIFFSQSFASPPKIAVWIQEFEWHNQGFMSITCVAEQITANRFKLKVLSWADRSYRQVRVQYLAYPAEEDGKRVKSGRNTVHRSPGSMENKGPFYGQPFTKQPQTFVAICETDFNSSRNLRFECSARAPNKEELVCRLGTWADTDMDHAVVQWIAIE
ncbi:hypothetical protein IAQ61_004664 [Plenodomus lingam]|uniref:uncharacterized protein n=1 Tax=Leptosphaeria maculans TaxID=5022 RepID=UPI00331A7C5E|nr:hypothetical protein IAQ61_004664 [Plenodomus lingam]